jgi:hypothetical protein
MGEEELLLQKKQGIFYISNVLSHKYIDGNEENEELIFECEFSREPVFLEGTLDKS